MSAAIVGLRKEAQAAVEALVQAEARRILEATFADIAADHPEVAAWFAWVVDDIVANLPKIEKTPAWVERYRVRVLRTITPDRRPVVIENTPTVQRLLGGMDLPGEGSAAPHLGIQPGALIEADGGTLVIQARDLLAEPGAWAALKRALRSGTIELSPQEAGTTTLRPPAPPARGHPHRGQGGADRGDRRVAGAGPAGSRLPPTCSRSWWISTI